MQPKRQRTKEEQELVDYLRQRWKDLGDSEAYLAAKLDQDKMIWRDRIDAGKSTPVEADRALEHAEYVVSRTIRYVMLTVFCTFLEETAREFARRACSDFEKRAHDKKGSTFARYLQVLDDNGLDTKPIHADLEKFDAIITLRNCVVHAWGKVSGARDPQRVADAVKMVETAEILPDGFLYLGNLVLAHTIHAAESIGNAMIDQLLPYKAAWIAQRERSGR